MTRALLALALLSVTPAAADEPTLEDSLVAEVGRGKSVMILGTKEGLVATSVDGARKHVLLPLLTLVHPTYFSGITNFVRDVRVDRRAQAVWFELVLPGEIIALWVLDLAAPPGAPPIEIARLNGWHGLPEPTYPRGPATESPRLLLSPAGVALEEKKGRRWQSCAPPRCPALAPAALPVLARLAARAAARAPSRPPTPRKLAPLAAAREAGCRGCGTAFSLPGTDDWAVYVRVYGDCCEVAPELYDPRAKEFISPNGRRGGPFSDAHDVFMNVTICADGSGFFTNGELHDLATGAVIVDSHSGDCLGGSWRWTGDVFRGDCGAGGGCDSGD